MPEGYFNHLRKEQWVNLCNFVKAVGGKLKISVANCDGLHSHDEPWNSSQAKLIFDLSRELGCPIEAVEFVNEPNMLQNTGFPKDYTAADFRRDQDIFHKWVRENYPECTIVGPSDTDPNAMSVDPDGKPYDSTKDTMGAGIAGALPYCSTADLLDGCTEPLDVFSYHYYNAPNQSILKESSPEFSLEEMMLKLTISAK